jgi:UDPglucose--hexose-1-phosphate uridylyltransferase
MIKAMQALSDQSHRRYNPLLDEWLLVSPGRTQRPWAGAVEPERRQAVPPYDPTCYLCPGNARATGHVNPAYSSTFVFDNDFAALNPDAATTPLTDGLLQAEGEAGTCRVMCFTPRHDASLGDMPVGEVRRVIDTWAEQTSELGADYAWVQVFENRGVAMGASNPHPHGQIWAGSALPNEAGRERETQRRHLSATGRRLLVDYAAQEQGGPRAVVENDDWLIVVPFWAVWPFETLTLPKKPASRLADLDGAVRDQLAEVMVELLQRYDRLFSTPFPYSMGWHQAPFDGSATDAWQLHAHYYPPLLRSASVRKFMVGYELLAEPQRDLTPEEAAERLRGAG